MSELQVQSPLAWPSEIAETHSRARSQNPQFKHGLSITESLGLLEEELVELKPERAILRSDYEQIRVERLRRKLGNHPGICLELRLTGKNYLFACDRWSSAEQNIYALHLLLRNYRLMEKWGVASLPKLLQGFLRGSQSHTAADAGVVNEEWMQLLGLGATATLEDAHATYRRRAKLVANDQEALTSLNNAMDQARKKLVL